MTNGAELIVTEVKIRKVNNEQTKIKANASVTLNGAFVIHDVRVIEGTKGLFVTMPNRKDPDGEYHDICHPITAEARDIIINSVLDKFHQEV